MIAKILSPQLQPKPITTEKYLSTPFNVIAHQDYWKIEMPVTGFDKTDVSVTFDRMILTVKTINENTNPVRQSIQMRFHVPANVDHQLIEATVINGLLTINMPKKSIQQIKIK